MRGITLDTVGMMELERVEAEAMETVTRTQASTDLQAEKIIWN